MFPHGGGGWSNTAYPPDMNSTFPRDPRTAARATLPNTNQAYEAGAGWTQGWSQPGQWAFPCPPTPPVPFPNNWIPNVAPQPGVNCPPIGVPPPGGDWKSYAAVSDKAGSAENKTVEQGSHEVNGRAEGTADYSLFLSNYFLQDYPKGESFQKYQQLVHHCYTKSSNVTGNPKPIRHLVEVPVSPAKEGQDIAEAKGCELSGPAVTKIPLEKTPSEVGNGMPIETLVNASRKPNGEVPLESSIKPVPIGMENIHLNKADPTISLKRKVVPVEQMDNTSSNVGKRLLLETSSFTPSLEGTNALFEKLENTVSSGKTGGPLEKRDIAARSANSGASQGGSSSTWATMCRERGMALAKEKTIGSNEKRTSPGEPGRTANTSEKQTIMGKWDSSVSSREKGVPLRKPEGSNSSRERGASLGKSDRTSSTKDKRLSIGNHDWAAHGMEKLTSLEKADSTSSVRGSREPYTPESPGTTDMRSDSLFLRAGDTGGGETSISHQILSNIGTHKAQEVAETTDPRIAAILAKKDEIEHEYEQNCKTFFLVAAMLLEQEPSIQQTVVSALRKTLREISKNGVKELENFIERYDEDLSRR